MCIIPSFFKQQTHSFASGSWSGPLFTATIHVAPKSTILGRFQDQGTYEANKHGSVDEYVCYVGECIADRPIRIKDE
jgi:hypothetical protein